MNLYKLSQTVKRGMDTFDSCIVCAENEEEAKKIHPRYYLEDKQWWLNRRDFQGTWAVCLEDVECEIIGKAKNNLEKGLVLASFNAG